MVAHRISDEEIIEIQSLYHDKKLNIPQIQEKTGKSTSVIDKYIKKERLRQNPYVELRPKKVEEKRGLEHFKVVFTVLLQANDTKDAWEKARATVQKGHESEVFIEHL